jgi:prepilin-type N-terminal cleavage/methylation domain-containing protein
MIRMLVGNTIKQKGFTIVELLIVIVVIAILAAITIVAYNGIQNRANDSSVQSDLRQFMLPLVAKYSTQEITEYPGGTDSQLNPHKYPFSKSTALNTSTGGGVLYCTNAARTFAMIYGVSKSGTLFYRTSDGRSGSKTTYNFGDFDVLCAEFTGSNSATNARYGGDASGPRSWTL